MKNLLESEELKEAISSLKQQAAYLSFRLKYLTLTEEEAKKELMALIELIEELDDPL